MIELLVSSLPGVQYGPPFYRTIEKIDKNEALKTTKGNYEAYMTLSPGSRTDL